jgi:hypothetical protein
MYEGGHRWIAFGRDPEKPARIIDTNQIPHKRRFSRVKEVFAKNVFSSSDGSLVV